MTLPTTSPLNGNDDDSDMFGPPRSSPVGYHHHQRSRVPMISPKLRQREERKRILQLCAHKLERIKDSEANLRRSVCINNTYSRLTDEVRREKQSRYLANLPKSETKPETAHDNMYSPYQHNYNNQMELRHDNYHRSNHQNSYHHHNNHHSQNNNNTCNKSTTNPPTSIHNMTVSSTLHTTHSIDSHHHQQQQHHHHSYSSPASLTASSSSSSYMTSSQTTITSSLSTTTTTSISSSLSSSLSSSSVDTDLEILDRELNAINASMPLIDPEITQGAEQLEKAVSSRKRSRTEEENDRLVREALSQFYLPSQRLISAIDDYPPDIKRSKLTHNLSSHHHSLHHHLHHHHHHCGSSLTGSNSITDLDLDLSLDINHQNQKEFEVIMDALRLGTSSPTPSAQDSCGQAAMMSESGVFHNLVVTSLET